MAQVQGKIVQCIGAVVDVEFPRDQMPKVYDALKLEGSALTLEVQQQLGDGYQGSPRRGRSRRRQGRCRRARSRTDRRLRQRRSSLRARAREGAARRDRRQHGQDRRGRRWHGHRRGRRVRRARGSRVREAVAAAKAKNDTKEMARLEAERKAKLDKILARMGHKKGIENLINEEMDSASPDRSCRRGRRPSHRAG